MTPAPDAMAWVTAFLPASDAMTVMTTLGALASACAPEDERPMDARRADALTDVLRGVLDSGEGPYGPLPTQQRRRPHLELTVSAESLTAGSDGVAELTGYGPVPASVVREVAAESTWRAVGVDPRTGEAASRSSRTYRPGAEVTDLVLTRDRTCTFPGCRVPARHYDIDHVEPFDHARPPEQQTVEGNLAALCRHHHRLKTHGGWAPARDPDTGVTTWRSRTGHTYTREPVPVDPGWNPGSTRSRSRAPTPDDDIPDATERILTERARAGRTEMPSAREPSADDSAPWWAPAAERELGSSANGDREAPSA
jgi:hypothetical protein